MARKRAAIPVKVTPAPSAVDSSMSPSPGVQSSEIVHLMGPHNIHTWNRSLLTGLGDLQPFITHKPTKPSKPPKASGKEARAAWRRNRKQAKKLLRQSLAAVKHLVKFDGVPAASSGESGALSTKEKRRHDPRIIYKSALHAMRIQADSSRVTTALVRELCNTQRTSFQSLAAYQNRIQDLRSQLSLLGCDPGDRFMVFLVLGGLGKPDAVQDRMLRKVFTTEEHLPARETAPAKPPAKVGVRRKDLAMGTVANKGSWKKLMEQFSTRAIKERHIPAPQSSPSDPGEAVPMNDLDGPVTP